MITTEERVRKNREGASWFFRSNIRNKTTPSQCIVSACKVKVSLDLHPFVAVFLAFLFLFSPVLGFFTRSHSNMVRPRATFNSLSAGVVSSTLTSSSVSSSAAPVVVTAAPSGSSSPVSSDLAEAVARAIENSLPAIIAATQENTAPNRTGWRSLHLIAVVKPVPSQRRWLPVSLGCLQDQFCLPQIRQVSCNRHLSLRLRQRSLSLARTRPVLWLLWRRLFYQPVP